ncbi:bacterial transcriptional activator domain-containing protein [Streptomyces sp. NPDC088921]|uniref:AfsR/SARP family transcriptional regulator n=1 Tax=unclassified Streptomyces TaxID=2593676 RepID=UPI00343DDB85
MASDSGCRSSLGLLGGWRLTVAGRPADVPPIARRLLALLALRGPLTRSQVADVLWPEVDEVTASCRLRTALWRSIGGRGLVETRGGELALAPPVAVDVRQMRTSARILAEAGRAADPTGAWEAISCPASLFEQDLLPNWWDDWLVVERERIRQTRLHALEALSALWLCQKRYAEAVDTALAAVHAAPLRESAHRAVILAHLAEGNGVEAVRQFEACRAILHQELGVPPSAALTNLLPHRPARRPKE